MPSIIRKILAAACIAILLCGFIRGGNGTLVVAFAPLKVGGGGYVTGLSFSSDGTKLARTNSATCYAWNGSNAWTPVITTTNIPTSIWNANTNRAPTGCIELQLAQSNTSVWYAMFNGYWLISTNKGSSWTDTGLTHNASLDPNNPNSGTQGPLLAVDPGNSDHVITGSPGVGAFYTTNGSNGGGATWNSISGISVPSSGNYYLFAFDPSTTSGGVTTTVFAFSFGNQVYKSTTGINGTFTATSGGPTTLVQIVCDQAGNLWGTTGSSVWKYTKASSTWAQVINDGNSYGVPAIDPSNVNNVVVPNYNGNLNYSTNGGSTWSGYNNVYPGAFTANATDIPWLAGTQTLQSDMSLGGYTLFDTSVAQPYPVYVGSGTGVFQVVPRYPVTATMTSGNPSIAGTNSYAAGDSVSFISTTGLSGTGFGTFTPYYVIATGLSTTHFELSATPGGTAITPGASSTGSPQLLYNPAWQSQTSGQETLVANFVIQPPGNNSLVLGAWDRSAFYKSGPQTGYATTQAWDPNDSPVAAWSMDIDYGASQVAVVLVSPFGGGSDDSAISTNGGQTYSAFTSKPTGAQGWTDCIAVGSSTNAVWLTAAGPYFTTNLGTNATWTAGTGAPTSGYGGSGINRFCVADRATPGTFYLYNTRSASPGVYKSTNNGATWTKVFTGLLAGSDTATGMLKSVPGVAGGLFWSGLDGTLNNFLQSSNGGTTWTTVKNSGVAFNNIQAFGFGAIFPGQSFPSIYVNGVLGSLYATFISQDGGSTWSTVTGYPGGNIDYLQDIDGDKTTPGYYYMATVGQGWMYYGKTN